MSSLEKTKVAIVGMGTVGTGVAKLLLDHGDRTARHAGRVLWLEKAVVSTLTKPRGIELPPSVLTDNVQTVLADPDIKVVAHLVGGLEPARTITLKLLEAGKDVVTANKAMLAEFGPELFDKARQLNRSIAFEASVCGGIPVIANISQCFTANQILSIEGILNGTSNFIIWQMEEKGLAYRDVVSEAQRLGYAEADPTMDVDGSDAAQKLAILSHLAFGSRTHWKDIPRQGLEAFDLSDVQYASELGYRIRLIASAELTDDGLRMCVTPTLIRKGRPLAEVRGPYNAVSIIGDAVGNIFLHGQGAGQMPTASAVVADMIDTAVGRTAITFKTLKLWSDRPSTVSLIPHPQTRSRYYIRLSVVDQPGALAQITGVLGSHNISIASVIQHEPHSYEVVGDKSASHIPIVIMTHEANEGDAAAATQKISELKAIEGPAIRLRVQHPQPTARAQ
jgi:homoserine dehydrogenase